jgi:hypothetical protein
MVSVMLLKALSVWMERPKGNSENYEDRLVDDELVIIEYGESGVNG